jgi:polyisoprenoid-binding protein YceI
MRRILLLMLSMGFGPSAFGQWRITQSHVAFTAWAWGMEHTGYFRNPDCFMYIPASEEDSATVYGKVDVRSIETGNAFLNNLLQGESYFHSSRYPYISVKKVRIARLDEDWMGVFDVTIKGKTKQYLMPLKWAPQGFFAFMQARWYLNLHDFGIAVNNPFIKSRIRVLVNLELESLYQKKNKELLRDHYR